MASIFDVAKYIVQQNGLMSTWKLQKLCYYAQAWSIVWEERDLFQEEFEAWANGPVCPELYQMHRGKYMVDDQDIEGDPHRLTQVQKEDVDIILRDYGDKEAYWLREQSHHEDPWKNARGNCAEGERCNTIISKQAMGLYYGSL